MGEFGQTNTSRFAREQSEPERLSGIIERVTFHSPETGWTVLKVSRLDHADQLVTVVIHQAKVFAGATMDFYGTWTQHPKHGEQFKVSRAVERRPASAAALEKYLGSGLIKGVGPATAQRIVAHFKERTLEVFENKIDQLKRVPGIAEKKLEQIKASWNEHRAIRDVMMFLQGHGISTLFAVKIYKEYGDKAIEIVSKNPYRLAEDIYGIGFFSADAVALKMGFQRDGNERIQAGIQHVLAASRDEGHCYLTENQIIDNTVELLGLEVKVDMICTVLAELHRTDSIKMRTLAVETTNESQLQPCYYSKSLYYDEAKVAQRIKVFLMQKFATDQTRVESWIDRYCAKHDIHLSDEQRAAVIGIVKEPFSILTGGPGCGKTTTTRVLVQLLFAMKKRVLLAAPTGRAAQRMTEVIGAEAKTLHRLLEWTPKIGGFKKNEGEPLDADFLIIDECSMLDISLAANLVRAIPENCQVLMIGDPDQLPAVGAGDVLNDLLRSQVVATFRLTKIFRQAAESSIIRFAHEINGGKTPKIESPLAQPEAFKNGIDCLFMDADEATRDQIKFLERAKQAIQTTVERGEEHLLKSGDQVLGKMNRAGSTVEIDDSYFPKDATRAEVQAPVLNIPDKFRHVDLQYLSQAKSEHAELIEVMRAVHPWSTIHYGLTAADTVVRLYTKTIREWLGPEVEVQILTPQVRGTLGAINLNLRLQETFNPPSEGKLQLRFGDRLLRVGDRVIQTRNNYDLGVFNGDIGTITEIDIEEQIVQVQLGGLDTRVVQYERDDLLELSLAYAITIHKSQGSEFQVVIIPVVSQHFNMLFRNLIYTGLTRAKTLAIFVGNRKAFAHAVKQIDNRKRQTALRILLTDPPRL